MRFTYFIEGMHCDACSEKIKLALSPYIKVIAVTLNPSRLVVESATPPELNELNGYLTNAGNYFLHPLTEDNPQAVGVNSDQPKGLRAYYPLFLIAAYIAGVAFINNFHANTVQWSSWMTQFMAGFFLVFSAFKFLDLPGFAQGYATYDLLAQRWYPYGFIYPFLELGLGILYLGYWWPVITAWLTILIMGFSSLGVINSLRKKQQIRCACLGTILNVPLSSITLIEDLVMVVLAALSLMMAH